MRSKVDQGSLSRAIKKLERDAAKAVNIEEKIELATKHASVISPKYTGRLSRSWDIEVEKKNRKYNITNAVHYFNFVNKKYSLMSKVSRYLNRILHNV